MMIEVIKMMKEIEVLMKIPTTLMTNIIIIAINREKISIIQGYYYLNMLESW